MKTPRSLNVIARSLLALSICACAPGPTPQVVKSSQDMPESRLQILESMQSFPLEDTEQEPGSCQEVCGAVSPDENCWCDSYCKHFEDCCEDFDNVCPGFPQEVPSEDGEEDEEEGESQEDETQEEDEDEGDDEDHEGIEDDAGGSDDDDDDDASSDSEGIGEDDEDSEGNSEKDEQHAEDQNE